MLPALVAATRSVPLGFFDNLVLSPDDQRLIVAARSTGAVFVYDFENSAAFAVVVDVDS